MNMLLTQVAPSSLQIFWLDATFKGMLILSLAALISLRLRKPSARHLAWGLGLMGAFVVPWLSVALPGKALALRSTKDTHAIDRRVDVESGPLPPFSTVRSAGEPTPAITPRVLANPPLLAQRKSGQPSDWIGRMLMFWSAMAFLALSPLIAGFVAV